MKKRTNYQKPKARNLDLEKRRQIATLKHYSQELVPEIYSAFCLVLSQRGWTHEQIESLVEDTLDLWNKNVQTDVDMIEWCYRETGIDVRRANNEQEGGD